MTFKTHDLELVLLAMALRAHITDLVPARLPPWHKDLRSPTAREGK
jgi:hypothetical protein